jgi:hypothetical protein
LDDPQWEGASIDARFRDECFYPDNYQMVFDDPTVAAAFQIGNFVKQTSTIDGTFIVK